MLFPCHLHFIKNRPDIPYSKLSLTFRIVNELVNWEANWFHGAQSLQLPGREAESGSCECGKGRTVTRWLRRGPEVRALQKNRGVDEAGPVLPADATLTNAQG